MRINKNEVYLVGYRTGKSPVVIPGGKFSDREKLWRKGYTVDAVSRRTALDLCESWRNLENKE